MNIEPWPSAFSYKALFPSGLRQGPEPVLTGPAALLHIGQMCCSLPHELGKPGITTETSSPPTDPEVHPQSEDYWGHVNPIGPRACYDEGKRVAETMCYAYMKQVGVAGRARVPAVLCRRRSAIRAPCATFQGCSLPAPGTGYQAPGVVTVLSVRGALWGVDLVPSLPLISCH